MEAMVDVAEHIFGTDSPALVAPLAKLGQFYLLVHRLNDATQIMERIGRLVGENPPEQSPGFLDFLQFKAMLGADRGDDADAEATFNRAIAVATKYGGPTASEVAINELNLRQAYLKAKKFDDAIGYFKSGLEILKAQSGSRALIVGYALAAEANAYAGKGDQATSAKLLTSAIKILGPAIGTRPQPRWL